MAREVPHRFSHGVPVALIAGILLVVPIFGTATDAGSAIVRPSPMAHAVDLRTHEIRSILAYGVTHKDPAAAPGSVDRLGKILAGLSDARLWAAYRLRLEGAPISGILTAGLAGCAVGGAVGAAMGAPALGIGALPGAAIGCAVAGVAAGIAFYEGFQIGAQSVNLGQLGQQWIRSILRSEGNLLNLTDAETSNTLAAYNLTVNAWGYATANAALGQLGNSTFNTGLDLYQSDAVEELGTVGFGTAYDTASGLNSVDGDLVGNFGPGGQYASTGYSIAFGGGLTAAATNHVTQFAAGFPMPANIATYIAPGSQVGISCVVTSTPCGGTYTITLQPYASTAGGPVQIAVTPVGNSELTYAAFPNVNGLWIANGQTCPASASCTIVVENGMIAQGNQLAVSNLPVFGVTTNESCASCSGYGYTNGLTGSCGASCTPSYVSVNGGIQKLPTYLWSILNRSAQQGAAYWGFLRALGYTSAAQVPANCVIPAPYMALPPNLNLGNLSGAQIESLLYSWAGGLAAFYNVPLNSTNFCGQPNHRLQIGSLPFLNPAVNATGYVYIANATKYPSEVLGNPHTWAYNGQLIIIPTLRSVWIPVNKTWEVPPASVDPVEVYVIPAGQSSFNGTFLTLVGNGTTGYPSLNASFVQFAGSSTPGAALFLTSCTVHGNPTLNCSVAIETVVQTLTNVTCVQCPSPPASGAWVFNNPFAALGNFICGLFGATCTSGLAGLVSGLLLVLFLIVIVVVVLVVVVRFVSRPRTGSGT